MSKEAIQEENRASKYISFREIPPLAKTRRWYVEGKDKKPFAIIKWYGGWRKYVVYIEADSFLDQDGMQLVADFLERVNREHGQTLRKAGSRFAGDRPGSTSPAS